MANRFTLSFVLVTGATLLLGARCQSKAEPPTPGAHFGESAMALRDALVDADLSLAKRNARLIVEASDQADRRSENPSRDLRSRYRELHAEALKAEDARDLAYTGVIAGRIFVQCGACHRAHGGPRLTPAPPPPEQNTVTNAHVARHAWALDRLYEGLITGDVVAWDEGAAALQDDTLLPPEMPSPLDGDDQADLNRLADRVHTLRLQDAETDAERGRLLGALMVSCTGCHQIVDQLPDPIERGLGRSTGAAQDVDDMEDELELEPFDARPPVDRADDLGEDASGVPDEDPDDDLPEELEEVEPDGLDQAEPELLEQEDQDDYEQNRGARQPGLSPPEDWLAPPIP